MNYTTNYKEVCTGLSYNQVLDVSRAAVDAEPVTLTEVKEFAAIELDYAGVDAILTSLIITAREMCEKFTGKNFVRREVIATLNNGNGGVFLPYGPIDKDSLAVTDYDTPEFSGVDSVQMLYPIGERFTVTYLGGYNPLPNTIKTAILETVRYLYDNRSADNIGESAMLLLKPYTW